MSDRFWETYRKQGGFLSDEETEEDGGYQPWVTSSTYGDEMPAKLLLVPARHISAEQWRIPYLQLIVQRFDRDTGQLSLLFPSSGLSVFLQGRGLDELDELIDQRRVMSVHMFDEALHHPVGNDAAIVTDMVIEEQQKF